MTWWSAADAMTLRPKISTLVILIAGLWIFGTGDAVLIAAGIGNAPWTVLAEGISLKIGWSIGQTTFLVSVLVLGFWIPLREKPGIGTILNAILIAAAIEYMLPYLPTPATLTGGILQVVFGVILVGIGSGLYLTANLGPGPRDGTMTGLQRITGVPIGWVRAGIEITVLLIGWSLGGTFWVGTFIFAFLIGPVVAISLNVTGKFGSTSSE